MNKTATRALVTGGSGGIGAAICRRLSEAGHFVYVHAHRGTAAAETVVDGIVTAGGQAAPVIFDLTDARGDAYGGGKIAGGRTGAGSGEQCRRP